MSKLGQLTYQKSFIPDTSFQIARNRLGLNDQAHEIAIVEAEKERQKQEREKREAEKEKKGKQGKSLKAESPSKAQDGADGGNKDEDKPTESGAETAGTLEDPEPLRLLDCGHVFHVRFFLCVHSQF